MVKPRPNCLVLLKQAVARARDFAAARAGSNMAARMAIIAMTTSNSINVKPRLKKLSPVLPWENPASMFADFSLPKSLFILIVILDFIARCLICSVAIGPTIHPCRHYDWQYRKLTCLLNMCSRIKRGQFSELLNKGLTPDTDITTGCRSSEPLADRKRACCIEMSPLHATGRWNSIC